MKKRLPRLPDDVLPKLAVPVRRLGEALASMPPYDPIVATKAGVLSSGLTKRSRDFSPDGIRRSIEGSLRRLRRSRVDWLFLHGPAPSDLTDELLKTLVDLKFKGDIGALGVAGRGGELDAAAATGQFTVFMTPVHAGLNSVQIDRLARLKAARAIRLASGSSSTTRTSPTSMLVHRPPWVFSMSNPRNSTALETVRVVDGLMNCGFSPSSNKRASSAPLNRAMG